MAKRNPFYVCQSCGHQSAKWMGKCPSCQQWDSFSEERPPSPAAQKRGWLDDGKQTVATPLVSVTSDTVDRHPTGLGELDRTLGGGIVSGSMILIGGDPGVGKSTLALQAAGSLAKDAPVLYVSGEESLAQIRMRAERLNVLTENILVLAETKVERIAEVISETRPMLVVVDSIQTIYTEEMPSAPGTVGQVREASGALLRLAKRSGIPIILIGHVTKEGAIAGPRLLEHMVDTVLYFEGEKGAPYRILRAVKNRFGGVDELGVFEMKSEGLVPVDNPSEIFLTDRPQNVSGSVVTASIAGARPLLIEIQSLVAGSSYASPKRTTVGVDSNRVAILLAIIEKRCGLHLMGDDVFVNVAGGIRVDEPAIDLAVAAAIVSGFRDAPIDNKTIVIGEVGLGGEVRGAPRTDARINEASRLGFTRAIIPKQKGKLSIPSGFTVEQVETVTDALDILLP